MTAPNPNPYQTWWLNAVATAIPWLAGGPNGQAEAKAWPALLDYFLGQLIAARYVTYPDQAPADALPHIGGDRKLVQGPSESNATFITRLKTAWGNSPITVPAAGMPAAQSGGPLSGWALAGTWLQLLEELHWAGFDNAVIVQQNGLAYQLSGTPVAGADNHALLTITTCSALSVALTSNVTPPTASSGGRSIPAGTPWWQFAESRSGNANVSDTDYCNRFAILFPGPLPSFFRTTATAVFTASDNAAVTWNNAFPTAAYNVMVGPPVVTDGGGPVTVHNDGTLQMPTGTTIRASSAFTGTVDLLAYITGDNPLANLHAADLARLQTCIRTWRPNSLCVGVYALAQGRHWGWPVQTWTQASAAGYTWGPSTVIRFEGA